MATPISEVTLNLAVEGVSFRSSLLSFPRPPAVSFGRSSVFDDGTVEEEDSLIEPRESPKLKKKE